MKRNIWLFVLLWMGFAACSLKERAPAGPVVLSHAGKDASCPYITKDAKGRTVISWVEKDSTADTGMMCYAISNDNGYTFSAPVKIEATAGVYPHAENLPKLLFRPDGGVIALFGVEQHDPRNKYAGKVMYAVSADTGRTWGAPRPLVTDTAGYDQRYFDMALLPDGEAAAIWLDNRKDTKAEGSALYWAVTAGGKGFQAAKPIAQTVCQCCRTRLYVAGNGDVHVAYRDIINDSIRDMVHQVSVDGGRSFSEPVRISADNWVVNGCPHTGPALTANKHGLHFAWFTMGGGQGVFYAGSADNGKTYTQKESLSKAPMAKHPQIVTIPDDRVVIVWDEPVKWQGDFRSRVGIAVKSPEGQTISSRTLTADSVYAAYPVAGALDDKTVLVAYTRKGEIVYERVSI
ncbi:exo-alpha-sialidase [Chitinophaga oryzae]|uniref:Exo-alpha-sialidase n=1 Tax=Chitinophaga oryzae TaxID=2725414 RepID=A0AAE7D9X7_9BACT|nr:sialidase family protein [Chitinophaga oryzae]QJB35326.1 exo-alpha-sialidase [Chitinophaga oryzae]QJB41862.1 exo-alpha-sialidase [Chitinophaga oryzae]